VVLCSTLRSFAVFVMVLCGSLWFFADPCCPRRSFAVFVMVLCGPLWSFAVLCGPLWSFAVFSQTPIFATFLRPAFSTSRVHHVSSEIRTKATPCVKVWQTSNLRRLRLGEERKKEEEERKKEETTGQKYNGLPYSIRRPQKVHLCMAFWTQRHAYIFVTG